MAFFVSSGGFKVCKPVLIGKSKVPRCFRKFPNPSKPYGMQYFHSKKAWMTTEIKIQVLTALDRKLDVESLVNRKVLLLFLDNAPSHPETLQGNLKNIKLVFLPKKTCFYSKNVGSQKCLCLQKSLMKTLRTF